MGFVRELGRNQKGVVESTLVIIPLLVLFLITVELTAVVNFRNIDMTFAQSAASTGAITSQISSQDEVISFPSIGSTEGLTLVVTHKRRLLPQLIAGLPFLGSLQGRKTDVVGVAVMEGRP